MLKTFSTLFTLCSLLMLSACGFQLRGNVSLPEGVEPLSVYSKDPYGPLSIALRNTLNSQQFSLAELETDKASTKTEGFQLNIISQQRDRRTLSLGLGATVAEYQLTESVEFELKDSHGRIVMGPITLSERRAQPNDPNKIVSTSAETEILRKEMLLALAQKIARTLTNFDYQEALQAASPSSAKSTP